MDVDQEVPADDDEAGIQPGRGARKRNVGSSIQKDLRIRTVADPLVLQTRRSMSISDTFGDGKG